MRNYFFFFLIMMTIKVIMLRATLFENYNIAMSVWYEISIVALLFAVVELWQRRGKVISYLVIDMILSSVFLGMVVYQRYFETIPTYFDLLQLNQLGSVSDSIALLIKPTDFLYFADIGLLIVVVLLIKIKGYRMTKGISKPVAAFVLMNALLISTINFTFYSSERIMDQTLFSEQHGILNSQMIKAYAENKPTASYVFATKDAGVQTDEISRIKGNIPVKFTDHKYFGAAKDKNLIVIQAESLQDFVINLKIDGQEITPNLNKWVKESFYFTNVFQQIGAGNTSDAEFIMNTSIYPKGDVAVSSLIDGQEIPSLPRILGEQGYRTATFHADDITYWNRDKLYPALGFDEYFAKNYFGDEDVVGIGPSDEVFYQKSMKQLKKFQQQGQPFYAQLVSLTNHTPFEMPEDKQYLDLPAEYEGTLIGNYLQSVRYADEALGQLFQSLQDAGLWDNSVIALYGDHSGVHGRLLQDEDVKLLGDMFGSPYSLIDRFNVPFIVYAPGVSDKNPQEIETTGGQLDMMPTIANLLGVEPNYVYFGQNLLQYENNLLGMRYYLGTGSLFNNDILYTPETSKRTARLYNIGDKDMVSKVVNPEDYFEQNVDQLLQIYDWSDAYLNYLLEK
ncbi:LTA synthase family protein [Aquibacillus salsiterrae]|uniref:LTA synthase family protein n=1 Tax=Aquibacillus salsiterrae TaxID=2950439 RepID=A0A9X4AEL2_9BACI|nr:LTA synthase family protein [Aquibacillus salsiterrae]MDC3416709.1 LTA synthase family protein [Aquibacillus salsiterrae]